MQPRASMIGKTEQEIYKYFTTKQEMAEDSLPILSANAGTALHRLVLAQQYKEGNLKTAEQFVHNKEFNFTGHIDAVSSKMGLGDVKTVSRSMYAKIKKSGPLSSHITQVNAYMATTGDKEGYIQYIMREDPTQQLVFKLEYDESLFNKDMEKIKRVQARVQKELAEGRLNYKQLRQGENAETLSKESADSHERLIKDTSKIGDMTDYFLHHQSILDKVTGEDKKQQLSFSTRHSNKALNPQGRREDQNTIEGMKHGWFGKQRSENTDFGSPYKLGEFHSILDFADSDISETFKAFDETTAEAFLGRSQMGVDFESLGLEDFKGSTIQVAANFGNDEYETAYLTQKNNELPEFHKNGGLGDLQRKLNLDLTKEGEIPNYAEAIFGEDEGKRVRVRATIGGIEDQERLLQKLKSQATSKSKNIIVANGAFEARQSRHISKTAAIQFSADHMLAIEELRIAKRKESAERRRRNLTDQQFFDNQVRRERQLGALHLREALASRGEMVDIGPIAKALNATAQQKGLIPKTGNFAVGTNVELLAEMLLTKKEIHEAVSDTSQQNPIAKKLAMLLQKVESGEINKENMNDSEFGNYFKRWNNELEQIHVTSRAKMLQSEIQSKGNLQGIEKYIDADDFDFSPLKNKELFKKAEMALTPEVRAIMNNPPKANKAVAGITGRRNVKLLRYGAAATAGLLIYAATKNAFEFSGRDDEANTIEGLRHGGWAQESRKLHTDFGSGFQRDKFHEGGEITDPTPTNYVPLLGTVGAGATAVHYWNKPFGNMKVDDLTYLGKIHPDKLNSEVLGRTQATLGDIAMAGVRRIEAGAGGLLRSFGVSELLDSTSYKDMVYEFELGTKKTESFAQYMNALTNRDLAKEGIDSVTFDKGKMYLNKGATKELLPGNFSMMRMSHDLNQNESMTQLTKAMVKSKGVNFIDPKIVPFLPYGGEGALNSPGMQKAHGYLRETLHKYLNLMDNPLDVVSDIFPDVAGVDKLKDLTKKIPGLGVGGERGTIGTTGEVLGRHAARIGGAAALLYLGYGTLNYVAQSIAPDNTVMGQAGLTGLGAEGIRTAHQTYARFSDITGLTHLRDHVDAAAPGMEGWKASAGLALSGVLAGAALGVGEDLVLEASATDGHYKQFLENRKATETMPEFLRKIPGLDKEYTKIGKYARLGGIAGLTLSLPFLVAGLGADKSNEELEQEYSGEKEVAVRKGRFWEASMTPWEGGKIDYFRPNWYRRLIDDPMTEELYEGEKISPFGRAIRGLVDPYWLEKKRYDKQPYPYAGPDGSAFGMFGPIYEATLGRVIKAPALMHQEQMQAYTETMEGQYGEDGIMPSGSTSLIRKQWSSFLEAAGLRGFGLGAIKEMVTGNKDIESYTPELASSAAMNSIANRFHDMQLGGGFLTTEAVRRVLQREEVGAVDRINPLKNSMPSWMPGAGFTTNFQTGDPFSKVKEGYYRLPGQGFASRYKELDGVDAENYADIYKYKILADVAHGSQEFNKVKGRIDNRTLTPEEMTIYNEVEEQLKARNESNEKFRDPATYETLLGKYSAILTDVARNNPIEHLTPFSPGHKFLPGQDPVDRYEETIYAKEFKRWSSPFEDFVKPAANIALKSVGIDGAPQEIEYARQLEDYFDKLEYVKYQNLANNASAEGDEGTSNLYKQRLDRTMSGLDPYMDSNALLDLIPKRERPYFEKFLEAAESEKARILERTSPAMRDIYLAQWDKQAMVALESGEVEMPRDARGEILSDIKSRAHQIRARRKAQIKEFQEKSAPDQNWVGWDGRVDLEDVKMKYLINEGRDYHYYGLWKDRMNKLARKPYVDAAAENLNFEPISYKSRYAEAYQEAGRMGVVNPTVAIEPGLETGMDLEIQMERNGERKEVLRDLGLSLIHI